MASSSPNIGSPARIRKLIGAQRDPLLAMEIHEVASSLRPDLLAALPSLAIKLARRRRFSLSLSVLRRIPSPSPSLLSSLTSTFSALSRPDLSLRLLPLLRPPIPPKHLHRLLRSLAAHPSSLPAALSLLRSSPPDSRSHSILIQAFARSGRLSLAYSLFNRIFRLGLTPDVDAYRSLMQGLCRKSQVSTASDLLEDMLNKGYVPDALTYSSLLNSLCRKKRLREAYKLLCRMKVRGCNPDIVHYNTVILGFCREGRPLDAYKVLEDMPERGCSPNLVSYTTLVNGLCAGGFLEQAKRYLEDMIGKGLVPHFSLFHGLVRGFCNVDKVEEACGVLEGMLKLGVVPHVDTWMMVLVRVRFDENQKMLEQMVSMIVDEEEWRRKTKLVHMGKGFEHYLIKRMRSLKR